MKLKRNKRNYSGRTCLNINKLVDVRIPVLKELMIESVKYVSKNFK